MKDLEEENQLLKEEIDILRQSTVIHKFFSSLTPFALPAFHGDSLFDLRQDICEADKLYLILFVHRPWKI